jgi:hypothetical protein
MTSARISYSFFQTILEEVQPVLRDRLQKGGSPLRLASDELRQET